MRQVRKESIPNDQLMEEKKFDFVDKIFSSDMGTTEYVSNAKHLKSNIEQKLSKCYSFGRCIWSSICMESGMKQDYTKTNGQCLVGQGI